MLAEMIEKIVALKQTQIFDIDGEHYTDGNITRIQPHVDRPRAISVSGLDSICKLIRAEREKVGATIMVQVSSCRRVDVMTTYLPDFSRNLLYSAIADTPGIRPGWREHEEAMIELRSLFIQNSGTEYLLDLLSHMSENSTVVRKDNGVTQQVEVRHGIDLKAMGAVKPKVKLTPFRTFFEVAQPESEFLLRVDKDRGIGFFEADGGIWKFEAKRNIAGYFEANLKDLIDDGKVVIMQ